MKATAGDLPVGDGWAYEIKWDGVRAVGVVRDGQLRLQSTNGRDITERYPELGAIAPTLEGHDVVLDGEVVTFNEDGRPDFGLLQPRMHQTSARIVAELAASQPVVWVIFDLLHLDGHDLVVGGREGGQPLRYDQRRQLLEQLVEPGPNWQVPTAQHEDAAGLLAAVRERGLEGLVAKRVESLYEPGKRTSAWRKVKVRRQQELVVGGWRRGEGSRAGTIGSLLVGYYDDGRLVYAGRVGSGLRQSDLARYGARFAETERATPPFDPPPPREEARDATWVEPTIVVEVAFGEWSRDGRLRHPSYLGERDDKDPTDVVREPS